MNDGLKMEYTEDTVTLRLEIRSTAFGEFERATVEKFIAHCESVFNHGYNIEHLPDLECADQSPTTT